MRTKPPLSLWANDLLKVSVAVFTGGCKLTALTITCEHIRVTACDGATKQPGKE